MNLDLNVRRPASSSAPVSARQGYESGYASINAGVRPPSRTKDTAMRVGSGARPTATATAATTGDWIDKRAADQSLHISNLLSRMERIQMRTEQIGGPPKKSAAAPVSAPLSSRQNVPTRAHDENVASYNTRPSSKTAGGAYNTAMGAYGAAAISGRASSGSRNTTPLTSNDYINTRSITTGSAAESDAGSAYLPSERAHRPERVSSGHSTGSAYDEEVRRQGASSAASHLSSANSHKSSLTGFGSLNKERPTLAQSSQANAERVLKMLKIDPNGIPTDFANPDLYVFGKTLGEGSFGKVLLGTHVLTGCKVAAKFYEKSKLVDAVEKKRVQREISIMKRTRHPNIAPIFEVIDQPRRIVVIMEYVTGGNLCNYVRANKRLDEKEARYMFRALVNGIDYCHQRNIVHRDVKLDNILLDQDKNIRIIDFGFSICTKPTDYLKTPCGSPSYAAPEIVARKPYIGHIADIWSIGVVLFALICGHFPFQGRNNSELWQKIMKGKYTTPAYLSKEAADLVSRMLNVDVNKRITIKEIKQHPWWFGEIPKAMVPPRDQSNIEVDRATGERMLDEDVVQRVSSFGINPDYLCKSVLNQDFNYVSTTYHLMASRRAKARNTVSNVLSGLDLESARSNRSDM